MKQKQYYLELKTIYQNQLFTIREENKLAYIISQNKSHLKNNANMYIMSNFQKCQTVTENRKF